MRSLFVFIFIAAAVAADFCAPTPLAPPKEVKKREYCPGSRSVEDILKEIRCVENTIKEITTALITVHSTSEAEAVEAAKVGTPKFVEKPAEKKKEGIVEKIKDFFFGTTNAAEATTAAAEATTAAAEATTAAAEATTGAAEATTGAAEATTAAEATEAAAAATTAAPATPEPGTTDDITTAPFADELVCPDEAFESSADECASFDGGLAADGRDEHKAAQKLVKASKNAKVVLVKSGKCYSVFRDVKKTQLLKSAEGATIDHITYCRKPKKPCTHTTKQARDKCLAKRDDLSCKVSREFVDANGCPQVDCSCVPKHPPQPTKESPACPKINIQRLTEECVSDAQRKCTAKQLLDEQGCPTVTCECENGAPPSMPLTVATPGGKFCPEERLGKPAAECAEYGLEAVHKDDRNQKTATRSAQLVMVKAGKCYTIFKDVEEGFTFSTHDGKDISHVTYCQGEVTTDTPTTAAATADAPAAPTQDKKAPGADKGANSGHWCPKNRLNAAADECAAHNMAPIKRVNGEEATASDSCDLALVRSGKCYTLFRNVRKGATLTTFDGDKCVSVTYCKSIEH